MYEALRKLTESPSLFLRQKKLEFLRNAAARLDRDIPDDDFFKDLADHVASNDEARRLCQGAFEADGRDEFGRLKGGARPGRAAPPPRRNRIPVNVADDVDIFFEDEEEPEEEPRGGGAASAAAAAEGPFRAGRPISFGLRDVWRATDGLAALREALVAHLGRHLDALRAERPRRDPVKARIAQVRKLLRLSRVETDLLVFLHLFYADQCDWFCGLSTDPFPSTRIKPALHRLFGMIVGAGSAAVADALSADGPLVRYGAVFEDDYGVSRSMTRYLSGVAKGDLRSAYYAPLVGETLPWDHFPEELRRHGETIEALVRADRGGRGLDVLLHGVAGAGKTSFARALAARLGMRAVGVVMDGEGPGASDRKARRDIRTNAAELAAFRLGAIAVAERECDPARDLVVVDEADQLLDRVSGNRLNDTLDRGRCVRVWLGNLDPGAELPESNLRRFDYAVSFGPLGPRERASIWRNCVRKAGLGGVFDEAALADLAERYAVSPGIVSRVCANLAATGIAAREGSAAAAAFAERLLESHAKLLGIKFRPAGAAKRVSAGYVLDGLSVEGDVPPADILAAAREHMRRLAAADEGDGAALRDPPRLNVLLSGPPGCGKTEFVKWLGEQLGRKVVSLGASDLQDKYVGETEKRIARAFREAEKDGSVLFFDEVDSFLRSRAGASQNWEVSQTNELLARLEDFKGLFVAATNFPSSLDPAVLRRFTFKLSFGYLDEAGKRLFFERFFGSPLTDEEAALLRDIPDLCPGDFRTVRQRLDYLPGGKTNRRRLAALREESDRKAALPRGESFGGRPPRRLGFGA